MPSLAEDPSPFPPASSVGAGRLCARTPAPSHPTTFAGRALITHGLPSSAGNQTAGSVPSPRPVHLFTCPLRPKEQVLSAPRRPPARTPRERHRAAVPPARSARPGPPSSLHRRLRRRTMGGQGLPRAGRPGVRRSRRPGGPPRSAAPPAPPRVIRRCSAGGSPAVAPSGTGSTRLSCPMSCISAAYSSTVSSGSVSPRSRPTAWLSAATRRECPCRCPGRSRWPAPGTRWSAGRWHAPPCTCGGTAARAAAVREHGQRPQPRDGRAQRHHRAGGHDGGADAGTAQQFVAQQRREGPAGAGVGQRGGEHRVAQRGQGQQDEQQQRVSGPAEAVERAPGVQRVEAHGDEADGRRPAGRRVQGGPVTASDVRDAAQQRRGEHHGDDLGGAVLGGPPRDLAEQRVRQRACRGERRGLPDPPAAAPGELADRDKHAEGQGGGAVLDAVVQRGAQRPGREGGGAQVHDGVQPGPSRRAPGRPVTRASAARGRASAGAASAVTAGCQPVRPIARTSAFTIRGSKCVPHTLPAPPAPRAPGGPCCSCGWTSSRRRRRRPRRPARDLGI